MKKKILIASDDKTTLTILSTKVKMLNHDIEVLTAENYKDGVRHIIEQKGRIHASIVDFFLPDASEGEMVNLVLEKEIPTVVLTSDFGEKLRQRLLSNDVLDVIFKDSKKGINNVINSIDRILYNYDTTVLIVDDSRTSRDILKDILVSIKLNILLAEDGEEALELVKKYKQDISLVLTDYNMPKMDGMDLVLEIRELYDKDELAIAVLSSSEKLDIPTQFIKIGANDFIEKPYTKKEVVTRVNSLLYTMKLFEQTRELSYKDYMTGAYNRRYFYSSGISIFEKAKRDKNKLAIATIDIDNFKIINDTYGHDIGDICIINLLKVLQENLRTSDLVSRFGGDEFVVLLENITLENTKILFEKLRVALEKNIVKANNYKIKFTVSIGISYGINEDLDAMIKISDDALYFCKKNGRDQVKIICT